jgi:hypothetical protein
MQRKDIHGNYQLYCIRIQVKGPCECSICLQQFRAQFFQKRENFNYEAVLSDREARQAAANLVQKAHANFQYLREQCEANGNTILKRWKKKSSEKRKALLLEVDPIMYPYQWSDIRFTGEFNRTPEEKEAKRSGLPTPNIDATQGLAMRPFRNVCLLPYLNLESLKSDPARLLTMLYNRIKYTPEQWAPFDNFLLDKQWKIGSLKTRYNRNCIITHGPDYGKLTGSQSRQAHAADIIGFPRAILVLEAQLKLSESLRAMVDRLLEGTEKGDNSNTFTQALEIGLKKPSGSSSCVEFASTFINQSFSAAPIFDMQALLFIS